MVVMLKSIMDCLFSFFEEADWKVWLGIVFALAFLLWWFDSEIRLRAIRKALRENDLGIDVREKR